MELSNYHIKEPYQHKREPNNNNNDKWFYIGIGIVVLYIIWQVFIRNNSY